MINMMKISKLTDILINKTEYYYLFVFLPEQENSL